MNRTTKTVYIGTRPKPDGEVIEEVFAPKGGDVKNVSLPLTGIIELKFLSNGYADFWNVKVY